MKNDLFPILLGLSIVLVAILAPTSSTRKSWKKKVEVPKYQEKAKEEAKPTAQEESEITVDLIDSNENIELDDSVWKIRDDPGGSVIFQGQGPDPIFHPVYEKKSQYYIEPYYEEGKNK